MVKTRPSSQGSIVKKATNEMITKFFGKTLTLRVVTRTLDNDGQLSSVSTADTSFIGDLQFGLDLDQRFLTSGFVEVGDAVLYIHPDALSTLPEPQDKVIDGNSVWHIINQIESPELGGTVTHYSYRCTREPNNNDS